MMSRDSSIGNDSYSSRGTLMTHTDRSSCAALSNTSKRSSEKASCWHAAMLPSPQFAAGCFRVRGSFITCGIDELRVNDRCLSHCPTKTLKWCRLV